MTTPRTALEELNEALQLANTLESDRAIRRDRWERYKQLAGDYFETHGKALSDALGGWLPISDAPKDGTFILAWLDAGNSWQIVQWNGTDWMDEHAREWRCISKWRPLPPAPTSANGSELNK